jgi:hypothetical protein
MNPVIPSGVPVLEIIIHKHAERTIARDKLIVPPLHRLRDSGLERRLPMLVTRLLIGMSRLSRLTTSAS